jgi:membrane-bound lytic murein transglycosylase D
MRIAMLAGIALTASSCGSAKKSAPVLPPKTAPALTTAAAAPPPPSKQSQPKQSQPKPSQPAPPPVAAKPVAVPAPAPAQAETKTQPAPAPQPDAISDLLARAEKQYQDGLAAFHSGQPDVAKQDFDNAVNTLLGSNIDIRSDDRLEAEFERIVEGIDHLDLGAAASDTDAQKSEPAPIDETNGLTPSADPNVKAKAQAEIRSTHSDLPLMMTDQVAGFISHFSTTGRGTFERAFARSGRYHDMMVKILKEEGVPQDLIYLAQAESGFHPLAVSRVGARGIWQFMGTRARGYGLHKNLWVDDRQDPEKSTRAAARHLRDLYAQFGDWYLAMAAYNSGPGRVQAAVKRTGYADFWELYRRNVLPKETRNYVPIILAVTIMTKNLAQYGFDDVSMDEAAVYDSVTINYPVDLRLVAECVDSTQAQLQELNPSLLRLTTPREGTFELHLPPGTKGQYQTAIAEIPRDMRLWWRFHKVQPGDTVASLSRTYHMPAKSIATANHLDGPELEAGAKVIIPIPVGKHLSDNATYARRITRYKVRRGDTVETVADNFGISPQMLRRWNGLRGDSLRGRRVLALHLPVSPSSEVASEKPKPSARASKPALTAAKASAAKSAMPAPEQTTVVRHKVKSGETLYSIANTYKTTVAALKRDNGDIAILKPGMILVVQPSQ